MTKKSKILISMILTFAVLITVGVLFITLKTSSHCMQINAPNRIIIYYNSESKNKVLEKNSDEYNSIYNAVLKGFEQTLFDAIRSKMLFKDVKINEIENTNIEFKGIKINFVYDNPQTVKYKSTEFIINGGNYWYQNLIFDIPNADNFEYNSIAIIPPTDSNLYVSPFNYSLHYLAYSNFSEVYELSSKLF